MVRQYFVLAFLLSLSITSDLKAAGKSSGLSVPESGILRHYPSPGALEVPSTTKIGITAAKPFDPSVASSRYWTVTGSRSGIHTGTIVLSNDGRTAIFQPFVPFDIADTISVMLSSMSEDGTPLECSFNFITCIRALNSSTSAQFSAVAGQNLNHLYLAPPPDSLPPPPPPPPDSLPPPPDSLPPPPPHNPFDSLSLQPPPNPSGLTTIVDNTPTAGRIFLSIIPGPAPLAGLMTTDENSNPSLYLATQVATDFVLQPNGEMTYFGIDNLYYGIDSLGNTLHTYGTTNGVITDGHELIVKNDGSYTLLGTSKTSQNLSNVGGLDSAVIQGGVIQTFDSTGNLVFEWRGIDHYNVQDDIQPGDITSRALPIIDFEHANSIDIDSDGNYLLSNRNLSEITKIDGKTGDIIWRFGGNHNQFTLIGDTLGISCQHYARWLKNGDILLFDNGVYHPVQESRAVEFYLDTNTMTATLKWQFRHSPAAFSYVEGNAERLDNGNTFIGWGSEISVSATEVDSNGTVVYEMDLPATSSYRALKYPYPAAASVASAPAPSSGLSFSVAQGVGGYEVSISSAQPAIASITLCDETGRVVQNIFDGNISQDVQHFSLTASSLADGAYFCLLHSSEGEMMRPVFIIH